MYPIFTAAQVFSSAAQPASTYRSFGEATSELLSGLRCYHLNGKKYASVMEECNAFGVRDSIMDLPTCGAIEALLASGVVSRAAHRVVYDGIHSSGLHTVRDRLMLRQGTSVKRRSIQSIEAQRPT
jgi:hypothetical protein